jgi:hypothetical protein
MAILDEALQSIKRMQEFDVATLPRELELGKELSFAAAVEPARRLIRLYKQMSLTVLEDIPDAILVNLRDVANTDYTRLKQILDFKTAQSDPVGVRNNFIQQLRDAYPSTFNTYQNFISFGVAKSVDFKRMENEARAMIQAVQDRAAELTKGLSNSNDQAKEVLDQVKKTALEQGVSQQSIYFKDEADLHNAEAEKWRIRTRNLAWLLGILAAASLFVHKLPILEPADAIQGSQLITSKILIFAVVAYMLILSAKNFLSHQHNAIVNKHRQNALMTFNALVTAGISKESKDIVLMHAAACIFAPQETGYAKGEGGAATSKTLVEMMPKTLKSGDGG